MVFGLVHDDHDIVGRLVVDHQLAVAVVDDTSRGVFHFFQEGVRVGAFLIVIACHLQHEQADDVDRHNSDGNTRNDILSVL